MHNGYLFKEKRLCMPKCSIRDLLVKEAHDDGLMGHFRIQRLLKHWMSIFTGLIWNVMCINFVNNALFVKRQNQKWCHMVYILRYLFLIVL